LREISSKAGEEEAHAKNAKGQRTQKEAILAFLAHLAIFA
jgi:hypothetical protein